MNQDGLALKPAGVTGAQIEAYQKLLCTVFGPQRKFAADSLRWRYESNPSGPVLGMDAWDGDRLAAHYATAPCEAIVDGRPMKGLLSLNTATHPDYQGRGLFTGLAEATYGAAASTGYGFVIGVANANSTPGFVRKLGFQLVRRLEAGLLVQSPRRFRAAPVQFHGDWREELIGWRLANPAARYIAAQHGDLMGVWARTHLPLVNCAAFLEAGAHVPFARRGPLGATLFIGLEPRLRLAGILPLPERLRPSPLNLIWRPLATDAPAALDPAATAFNFLDFDPY